MTSRRLFTSMSLLLFTVMAAMPFGVGVAQESGQSITVQLQEFEDSGVTGTAILSDNPDGGIHVSMVLTGEDLAGNHPTHIHTGTCQDFNPNPLYPLETVNLSPVDQEGISESDVADTSLESLREGEYVILVHQSPEELTNYLVCGEIANGTAGDAVTPAAGGTTTTGTAHHMPVAGIGFGLNDDDSRSSRVVAFCALAFVSAASASILLRLPNRR